MSKISISVGSPTHNLDALKLIRNVTGLSLASIESRLSKGKEGIFFCGELFLNDHIIVDKNIRTILSGLKELGLEPFIMEISENESWSNIHDFDSIRISSTELLNMLDSASGHYS